jgi:hypothetical protein
LKTEIWWSKGALDVPKKGVCEGLVRIVSETMHKWNISHE